MTSTVFLTKELSERLKQGMIDAVAVKHGTAGLHTAAQVAAARALVAEVRAATTAGAVLADHDSRHLSHIEGFVENAPATTAAAVPTTPPTGEPTMLTFEQACRRAGLSAAEIAELAALGHAGKPASAITPTTPAPTAPAAGVRLDAVAAARAFNTAQRARIA